MLHPSTMYGLFNPFWWGHVDEEWVHRFAKYQPLTAEHVGAALPGLNDVDGKRPAYTAVKFYFNDCFTDTPENRAFVDRTIRSLVDEGPVISLSTGVAVDDHSPCEPDVAAMQEIRHLLGPSSNLMVQSAIVAHARRFVGTYGGFAYLAPLCGVPAVSYYSEPGSYSTRHLELVLDVLRSGGSPDLLTLVNLSGANEGAPSGDRR